MQTCSLCACIIFIQLPSGLFATQNASNSLYTWSNSENWPIGISQDHVNKPADFTLVQNNLRSTGLGISHHFRFGCWVAIPQFAWISEVGNPPSLRIRWNIMYETSLTKKWPQISTSCESTVEYDHIKMTWLERSPYFGGGTSMGQLAIGLLCPDEFTKSYKESVLI